MQLACTRAEDVFLVVVLVSVEHVLPVDDPLPYGHGDALAALGGVGDAGVALALEVGFDDALKKKIQTLATWIRRWTL